MEGERALFTELARLRRAPFGKRLVHYFSSRAKGVPGFEAKLERAAEDIAGVLAMGCEGNIYSTAAGDLVFVYSQISTASILTLLNRLDKLFFDGKQPEKNLYNEYNYYKIIDATRELGRLIEALKSMVAQHGTLKDADKPPIGLKEYENVRKLLSTSNIRSIIFNQPVYMVEHKVPSIEYLEFFTSIQKLEELACPEHSIPASPWFFNLIKHDLDIALMSAIVSEIPQYRHKAFSINLLADTFLDKRFDDFIAKIPSRLSGRLYVELDRADFIQHSAAIDQMITRSQELNTPIVVDGLSQHDLKLFRLSRLKTPFAKLKWCPQIPYLPQADIELVVRELRDSQPCRLILSRCDSPKALSFARAMNITLVQGRLIDKLFRMGVDIDAAAAEVA